MELLLDATVVAEVLLATPASGDSVEGSTSTAASSTPRDDRRVWASCRSLQRAHDLGFRRWISVAQAPVIRRQVLQETAAFPTPQHAVSDHFAGVWTERLIGVQWLAQLAGDQPENPFREDPGSALPPGDPTATDLAASPEADSELASLRGALNRLSAGAALLTRCPRQLAAIPQALTPEAYLARPLRRAPVPFIDLAAQQDRLRGRLETRLHRVLHHGQYIMGPEIAELEAALLAFTGSRHAITCANGTDALLMALMALNIGPGDAVFTTPFTFVATSEMVALLGATPVFADIDPDTYNLDPDALATAIAEVQQAGNLRPAAIIPVDLFGLPADYHRLREIAAAHGLPIIQDAAQAFGATFQGRTVPTQGTIGCTSFFPAKPLGAYGDGGAVFTDDDALADRLRSIRNHGQGADRYDTVRLGLNGRLDTLQAAILLEKLAVYPAEIQARWQRAGAYCEAIGHLPDLRLPRLPPGSSSVFAQFTVRHPRRDHLRAALTEAGLPTALYYPQPTHCSPAYSQRSRFDALPEAERAAREVFSLPFGPDLPWKTIQAVGHVLAKALQSN